MPKKRQYQFKYITSQHQSQQSGTTHSEPSSSTRSVNERLAQLRAEQAPRPTPEQRDAISMVATSHTLPPQTRQLLGVPETAPPLPKRRPRITNGRRVAPGPAAPQSWLYSSAHAPKSARKTKVQHVRQHGGGTSIFSKLACLCDNTSPLPENGSLVDLTLKSMATNWSFVVEFEHYNLPALPLQWKTALFSYLGAFGLRSCLDPLGVKALFSAEQGDSDGGGGDELVRMDLTGLISGRLTISDLEKLLYCKPSSTLQESSGVILDAVQSSNVKEHSNTQNDASFETWEDEAHVQDLQMLSIHGKIVRFPNLSQLSLGYIGGSASWSQLLSLTQHTPSLTHLSLAQWPVPTTIPNSKTAFITQNHAAIPVSGTHFYSRLDDDWAEAASILRRLSKNLYRLKWLDLEGCNDWLPALTWQSEEGGTRDRWVQRTFGLSSHAHDSGIAAIKSQEGPDWNGSWSQLTYVNIAQDLIPRNIATVRAYPAGVIAAELLLWLRYDENTHAEDVVLTKGMDIPAWLQREKEARAVARTVRALRSSVSGKFCEFDHGWKRPVGAAAAVFKDKSKE